MKHSHKSLVAVGLGLGICAAVMAPVASSAGEARACLATKKGDRIPLTAGDDECNGRRGDDIIKGRAGRDGLIGGPGEDTVVGGKGNDTLSGGTDADEITGGGGKDLMKDGSVEGDVLRGGAGNDTINGTDGVEGNDVVDGGDGVDTCTADPGDQIQNCEGGGQDQSDLSFGTTTGDVFGDITDDPDPVASGADITYTIPVTNLGTGTAKSVTLRVQRRTAFFPPYVLFHTGESCTLGTDSLGAGTADCTLPNIAPGRTRTITLTGTVTDVDHSSARTTLSYDFFAFAANDPSGAYGREDTQRPFIRPH